jgi:hypothetical protein|uniref:hypothetical protein n=1 Tax=Alloprevotella sp. TaxID=1872471 RepID=UPI0015B78383
MKEKSDKGVVGALMMLMSGIALSVAGFVVDPVGEISDSVLWYVSQALIYAGSVFGVTVYIDRQLVGRKAA